MENQTVIHINQEQRYRIVIERAASTKGTLGYKVEANGDEILNVVEAIDKLKRAAEKMTESEVKEA